MTTTVLFATGEDTGLTLTSTNWFTTAGLYRSTYSRGFFALGNTTVVADPPANRATTDTFTAGNEVWFHAYVYVGNGGNNNTTSNEQALIMRSPDGVSRVVLRQTGTAGQLKLCTRNSAGTITDVATATGTYTQGAHKLDWRVVYDTGSTLYIDGVSILDYTGDLRTDAATQLNQVTFASLNNGANNTAGTDWSEIIVADGDTRSLNLWTLQPVAAGNTQSFTPNTVGNINEVPPLSDATLVSTGSNDTLSQWTTPTSAPSGTWTVKCIVQEARAEVGVTGPQHFDWSVRTSSTNYLAGTSMAPAVASFGNFRHIWTTNPNTSAAWAITDIASGFNLGIDSLA